MNLAWRDIRHKLGRFVLTREGEVQGGGIVTGLGGR